MDTLRTASRFASGSCLAQACTYHAQLTKLKRKEGNVAHPETELPDIEDLVTHAKSRKLCPYHYARELQQTSEVSPRQSVSAAHRPRVASGHPMIIADEDG